MFYRKNHNVTIITIGGFKAPTKWVQVQSGAARSFIWMSLHINNVFRVVILLTSFNHNYLVPHIAVIKIHTYKNESK